MKNAVARIALASLAALFAAGTAWSAPLPDLRVASVSNTPAGTTYLLGWIPLTGTQLSAILAEVPGTVSLETLTLGILPVGAGPERLEGDSGVAVLYVPVGQAPPIVELALVGEVSHSPLSRPNLEILAAGPGFDAASASVEPRSNLGATELVVRADCVAPGIDVEFGLLGNEPANLVYELYRRDDSIEPAWKLVNAGPASAPHVRDNHHALDQEAGRERTAGRDHFAYRVLAVLLPPPEPGTNLAKRPRPARQIVAAAETHFVCQ